MVPQSLLLPVLIHAHLYKPVVENPVDYISRMSTTIPVNVIGRNMNLFSNAAGGYHFFLYICTRFTPSSKEGWGNLLLQAGSLFLS